ncbi:MAG: DNA-3-methyladenine glycosylase 2 family protein [bacterium]
MRALTRSDARLAHIVGRYGPPPMWARKPGFATLLYIILEQQVSLAAARAAYTRLIEKVNPLTPAGFLGLDARTLRRIGFSRQKADYGRALAEAVQSRRLDLAAVGRMNDTDARSELLRQRGIGPWSADVYLLQALRRPDVWPSTDLALIVAVQDVLGLASRPGAGDVELLGEVWRPWRAIAARMFWHYYLSRGNSPGSGDMA